jgi:hypothetical protein
MLSAFLAAKKGLKENRQTKPYMMYDSILHGYSIGNYVCILSAIVITIIVLGIQGVSAGPSLGALCLMIVFISLFSMISGLILYLPCAFFGHNLYARKRAEEEIDRIQQQILQDIGSEKSSENH